MRLPRLSAPRCEAVSQAAAEAALEGASDPEALAALEAADELGTFDGQPRWSDPSWGPWRALIGRRTGTPSAELDECAVPESAAEDDEAEPEPPIQSAMLIVLLGGCGDPGSLSWFP